MGGISEWIPPQDGSLDGGLEWDCTQLHFQLTVIQDCHRDPQKGGGVFNKLRGRMVFYFTDNEVTYSICNKGSSKTLSLHLLVQKLKALELALGFRLEVIHASVNTMITQGTDGLSTGI
jgi:hypothetical protein